MHRAEIPAASAQLVELAAANAIFLGFSKIALALGDVPDDLPLTEQATPDVAEVVT